MKGKKETPCCKGRTPWMRGEVVREIRPDAVRCLSDALERFAARRVQGLRNPDASRNFRADARRLVRLKACRDWVEDIQRRRAGLVRCDAEAAIVSVYAGVVTTRSNGLYGAYSRFIGNRLEHVLRPTLRAIHLYMADDELRREVIDPMADHFFDALTRCESDPNRLPSWPEDGRNLPKRPYAWTPGCDPLRTSLPLLLIHQAGKVQWPNALLECPLAFHLLGAGLADVVKIERPYCEICKRYLPETFLHKSCPDCGRTLAVRRRRYLLATSWIEDQIARGARGIIRTSETKQTPIDEVAGSEQRGAERKIAFSRLKELWHKTVTGRQRDLRKMAVLFALTDIERVPAPREWGRPRQAWLRRIGERLSSGQLRGGEFLARSRRFLARIARLLEMEGLFTTGISSVNVRVITSRFRSELKGKP